MQDVISKGRASQTYQYRQLSTAEEFRLLKVQPCSESQTGIELSIVHVQLHNSPSYETVSYVWGDIHTTQPIQLSDGSTLEVTSSLARAMPHLSKICQTGHLWIDQISINQSNIHERSNQVQLMGEIYCRCSRCVVWVDSHFSITGERGPNMSWNGGTGDAVRDYLHSFRGEEVQQMLQSLPTDEAHQLLTFESPLRRPNHAVRDHLLWFLEHPWFTRTWVYQEFVMPGEITFLIGDYELPGVELENVFKLSHPRSYAWYQTFHRTLDIAKRRAVSFDEAPGLEFLLAAFNTRSLYGGPIIRRRSLAGLPHLARNTFINYEACTFIDMIYAMSRSQASDPRDHVYALLGFAPFLLRHMKVDYTMPVEETFAIMLKAFMKESRSLDFLAYLPSESVVSHSRLNLPSWVPDWTVKHSTHTITCQDNLFCSSGKHFGLPGVQHCKHYDPQSLLWQHQKWNQLSVPGKIIDTVEFTLKKLSIYQVEPMTSIDVHRTPGRLAWHPSTLSAFISDLVESGCQGAEELSKEALLRTLLMDGVQWGALDALASGESLLRADIKIFDLPHYEKIGDVIKALLSTLDVDLDNLPHGCSVQLLHELSKVQYARRVFLSAKRRFGLGPDLVNAGDAIALLHGGRTPVVMRRRADGAFTMVGQCYLDEAMYGEFADLDDENADIFNLI